MTPSKTLHEVREEIGNASDRPTTDQSFKEINADEERALRHCLNWEITSDFWFPSSNVGLYSAVILQIICRPRPKLFENSRCIDSAVHV